MLPAVLGLNTIYRHAKKTKNNAQRFNVNVEV